MIQTAASHNTMTALEVTSPHVLPMELLEAYVDAYLLAATDNPHALTGHDYVAVSDVARARERFLGNITIGCVDSQGRVVCAGSISYTGDVAEIGNLFRTQHAPKGTGAIVAAARLEHAITRSNHVVTDVCNTNRGVMNLFKSIGWQHWIQNDSYSWMYLGGKPRVAEAIRILRTTGWKANGICLNNTASDMAKLSTRYYADDHYYGF